MNIGIWGISGFLGQELLKILVKHQQTKIVYQATSQKSEGDLNRVQSRLFGSADGTINGDHARTAKTEY